MTQLKHFEDQRNSSPEFSWPDWCWLPMAASAAIVREAGLPDPADIGRIAAVGQWTLTGRHVVLPDQYVTDLHVPDASRLGMEVADMDLAIDRTLLLRELEGHCYYLANPVAPPDDGKVSMWWTVGLYVHLEHDVKTGRAELRMLLDHDRGWEHLTPVWVHIDQPSLAWSARDAAASIRSAAAGATADMVRALVFMVWPMLAALLNPGITLTGPTPLPQSDTYLPLLRGAQVWHLAAGDPTLRSV
ncbi:hypothetical protein [Actinocatenispora comari]|uniref:hypothetical protein n=1 Tax=Actinocatenispora comari TaxID=2807577 RepID=UPI001A911330|nr:hypothetical protein [Actinocatenispora comari]